MRIVEIKNLTKVYATGLRKGNVVALDSVSFGVDQGEVFGLLGPNGAGKTTLVKVLLGITSATGGDVLVNGRPPRNPESREKVGFLPESPRFPDHLTGRGLLTLAGRMCGMTAKEIGSRTTVLLELVGMGKWADTRVGKYSKGMIQRVGLAQALVADPDLIFLDEPTEGIDPIGKVEIRDVLKRIRDQGKTVFLNSHLLGEVEMIADRVAILSRGRLVRIAGIGELTVSASQYEVEADIGNEHIELPDHMGKIIMMKASRMTVHLEKPEYINHVIDQLRMQRINIRSVTPAKQSLERSFLDAVSEGPREIG